MIVFTSFKVDVILTLKLVKMIHDYIDKIEKRLSITECALLMIKAEMNSEGNTKNLKDFYVKIRMILIEHEKNTLMLSRAYGDIQHFDINVNNEIK
jgi:hypothetical protein